MLNVVNKQKDYFKRIDEGIQNDILADMSLWKKLKIQADVRLEARKYGITLEDYFIYGFYWKTKPERRRFVCWGEANRILDACNDPEKYYIFDQKPVFNDVFSNFLGREWLDMKSCTYDEFCKFAQSKDRFFAKPGKGSYGNGARIIETGDIKDYKALYEELCGDNALLEEVVIQHRELAEFNATSANTMRVASFVKANGEVEITAAIIRIGRKGRVVDNFHNYGIAALIDIDTGIVCTTGLDRTKRRYVLHPDSGKQIVGFKIPEWKKLIETVKKAALVVPQMRYVGWDIAVDVNGNIIFIEGNKSADHDASQITDNVGKWHVYMPLVEELKKEGKARK